MKHIFIKIKLLILILIMLLSLVSCTATDELHAVEITTAAASDKAIGYKKFSYEFFGTFDTVILITGYAQNQTKFDEYSSYAFKRFNELHKLFDNYKTYNGINNIKSINDNSNGTPIKVDKSIIDLLEFCISANKTISPKVDISMGAVLNVWHNYREAGLDNPEKAQVPTESELFEASAFTGIDNITIKADENTVTLSEGTKIDLGAVAKGYATQIIADELLKMGFESFFISSGGNIKAVGKPFEEGKDLWSIGIQNPFYFDDPQKNENLIDIAYIKDMSVVTSGDYQRLYTVNGTAYHHLIDPETLFPAKNFRSVTIFTEDSALADFLSTAVFTSSYEQGLSLIENIENTEAYWVFPDGRIKATEGTKSLLKNLGGATN